MVKKIIFTFIFVVSSSLYLSSADESDLLVPANFNVETLKQEEQRPNQYQEVLDLSDDLDADDSDIDEIFIDMVEIPDMPVSKPAKPSTSESIKLAYRIALMKVSEISTMAYVTGLGFVLVLSGGGFVVYKKYKNKK